MDNKNLTEIVQKEIEEKIGNTAILLGYFEHQVDLLTQVVKDLSAVVDTSSLSAEAQDRLNKIGEVLAFSSVDFANITSPLENYKIPMAVDTKKNLRTIQAQYLLAKLKEEGKI